MNENINPNPALDGIEKLDGTVKQNRFHRLTTITNLDILGGSAKAIKINRNGKQEWIPKAHLRILNSGGILELWVSVWICNQNPNFFKAQ